MEKTILIGGKAGQGTAVTSHLVGKVFCHLGYYVFNYRDYPSLITGGHNFNVLSISDKPIFSHREKYDIIVALDQKTIDLHRKNLNARGFVLGGKNLKTISENNILLGRLFKSLGVEKNIVFKVIKKEFPAKEKAKAIQKVIEEGYNLARTKEIFKRVGKEKYLISGNEAVGLGAVAGGLDIYLAYPMTPTTPLLHFLAKKQAEYNILVSQLENEIGVINAALGASFSGAKVMVGTSGGGFALMTEALSLSGMAELPLVVYLGQRTAPSTGVPTYTGQGDLKFALNAGQGEFPRVVVAPGDPQECLVRTQEAFYLSCKYRTPAIVLADKHLGESNYTFDKLAKSLFLSRQKLVFRVNSYEHRPDGHTTEDPQWIIKMNDRRIKKGGLMANEIRKLKPISIVGKGKNLIIGWGSTKGAIIDALPKLKNFRFLQISYLSPFPREEVLKEIKKSPKVILVENNVTGLLGEVIREQTGYEIKNKILKYDARPFTSEFLIKKIWK